MSAYREMKIDKSLYQRRGGFFRALEEMDPSADYRGTDLENSPPSSVSSSALTSM